MQPAQRNILGNVGDKWTKFLKEIGDSGCYDWTKKQFQGLLDMFDLFDMFDKFEKDGKITKIATLLSDTFTDIGEGVKSLVSGVTPGEIREWIDSIIGAGKGLWDFGAAAVDVVKDINKLINGFLGLDEDSNAGFLAMARAVGLLINPWATAFAWLG